MCGGSTTSAGTVATSWSGTTIPSEETSGTCRQFTCKYHGWRYDLDGSLTFVQQESEFFDLDKADFGLVPVQTEVWEGFIFVNLDPDNTTSVREYLGRAGRRHRGVPVRRDDPGLQVPGQRRQQLEALHRRVRRVLPCTGSAREAGDRRGVAQAAGLRVRGALLRDRRAARHGVVVGRHVPAEGPRHGEADRAGAAQRPLRAMGPAGHRRPRHRCPRASIRPATRRGASTPSCSSPTSCCWCGPRAGT